MGGLRISAGDRRRIIDLGRAGVPYRTIAEIVDRPIGTISRTLSDAIMDGQLSRRRDWDNVRTAHYDRRDRS